MSSINNFALSTNHEKTFHTLLRHPQTTAVSKPFSTKDHSTLITDASPAGIGAVLGQCRKPVTCISRRPPKT
ncbi:uncharacterized protein DEA37_0004400 [Paragonimus westermani]|uniref:Reverse transcriptase/retrotransposon-derived protein RNase H-like domain-containing protein n=1 Tax=Paragonimus westermani TaxID=34504 RepID=A0A5J4NC34_9TREM|nr:uncharacterized protein DEA37_0004400 [Paragonimus westermani]